MYESHRSQAVPAVIAIGAAASVIVALRRGVFPFFWVSRSTQPMRFWLGIALTLAVGAGCLAWTISIVAYDLSTML
jgi:hypothetical protein